ncbi:hypothetical protein HZH68_005543 [Vespula germanica]|uniref:Uncharacterized protein n=1 Tax=Vespula germanica TaxID=30212 RepID=A0A834NFK8_VESGE|nr:hypothetical protein HZH68_005543 [Vespula germanica]
MTLIKSLLTMRKSLVVPRGSKLLECFEQRETKYFKIKETLQEGSPEVRPVEFLVEQPVRQSVGSSRHDGDTSSTRLFGCEYMRAAQGVLLRASHENARRQELPPADRGPKIASETNDLSTFHDEDETPSIPPSPPSIPLSTPSPSLLDPPVVKTSTKSFGSVVFEIEGKDSISTR